MSEDKKHKIYYRREFIRIINTFLDTLNFSDNEMDNYDYDKLEQIVRIISNLCDPSILTENWEYCYMGIFYESIDDYEIAEKYYLKAMYISDCIKSFGYRNLFMLINKNISSLIYEDLLKHVKNLQSMKDTDYEILIHDIKYMYKDDHKKIASLIDKYCPYTYYEKYINDICYNNNRLYAYYLLFTLDETNSIVKRYKNYLIQNFTYIRNFHNKINLNYKLGDCFICYDENIKLIPFECAHFHCIECYAKLGKCSICKD